jgi:predicted ATPase
MELLRRDDKKYAASPRGAELVFFDRSAVESLAMVHETAPLPEAELRAKLAAYRFHKTVFVLPPWEAIYKTDSERDQTFAHAARVHSQLLRWYRWYGYEINEVPCCHVAERATHVLQQIAGDA